jgi:hypothetical protein
MTKQEFTALLLEILNERYLATSTEKVDNDINWANLYLLLSRNYHLQDIAKQIDNANTANTNFSPYNANCSKLNTCITK